MEKDARIYVAGHKGLAGSAIMNQLRLLGYENLIVRRHDELDLTDTRRVFKFFQESQPEYVFIAAARVGGIYDSSMHPVDFIRDNLSIQWNIIEASFRVKVRRLLFLGSSCIYSNDCPRPIKEEYFNSGRLEPTNRAYSAAKIAGIQHCWAYNCQYGTEYICAMPTNLFGPNDKYDLQNGHVLASLIRKFHEAKEQNLPGVSIWGTGKARREFLSSDDFARACCHLMNLSKEIVQGEFCSQDRPPIVNIGTGKEIAIWDLALLIKQVVGYKGGISCDVSKPDGTLSKKLDISLISKLGWEPQVGLVDGIENAYQSFLDKKRFELNDMSLVDT